MLTSKEINSLWEEHSNEPYCRYSGHSNTLLPKQGLFFIGINPSLDKKMQKELSDEENRNCKFYRIEEKRNESHKYFRKFFDIADATGLKWGHFDLLYNRETKQHKIAELAKTEKGRVFIQKQLIITKKIFNSLINEKKPNIFVVNNTLARDLLGTYYETAHNQVKEHYGLDYSFVWDENLGTYCYKNNPFFFTSMLTGQRALDKGSYRRLVWHINYVKNKLQKVN